LTALAVEDFIAHTAQALFLGQVFQVEFRVEFYLHVGLESLAADYAVRW
jgi:hypothetical protein